MSIRYREFWHDRFEQLPVLAGMLASTLLVSQFNVVRFLGMTVPTLRPLTHLPFFSVAAGIASWFLYFSCVVGGMARLLEWHDKRVYEERFTEDERKHMAVASEMANACYGHTETQSEQRLRRDEHDKWLDQEYQSKGFTPLRRHQREDRA